MSNAALSKSPLDTAVPSTGRAADAYEVACTAAMLHWLGWADDGPKPKPQAFESARHATLLHIISGRLHRIAERLCNEDLTCRACDGAGKTSDAASPDVEYHPAVTRKSCRACAGRGNTLGRSETRLEASAKAIADHYALRVYFQSDSRGCSLYLIDPDIVPKSLLAEYGAPTGDAMYRNAEDWVRSNYTRGHAVTRLGR